MEQPCPPGFASTTPAVSAATPATPGASGVAAPSAAPGSGGTAAPSKGRDGGTTCNDNDLSIGLSLWRQDSGQNVLVTATNVSGKACTLYHYPYVGFGATIKGPLGPYGTPPRAIATIAPGQEAYAGVYLFRGGEATTAVDSLSLGYQDRTPGSNRDVGRLDLPLAARTGTLNAGHAAKVTYWNLDLRAVEDQLFRPGTS